MILLPEMLMLMKFRNLLLLFLLYSFFVFSCKQEKKEVPSPQSTTFIKYANGFEIQEFGNYRKLIIKSPYPNAAEFQEFYLVDENKVVNASSNDRLLSEVPAKDIIKKPLKKVVVTSTTHIPMLELLGEEISLVGFPNLKYISSAKTNTLINEGKIKELGKEEQINTEVLLELQPEAVIGFSLGSNNKLFENIEKAGIPVLLNGDWLEETPLGRAEWIKFFGALFNKEKQADSIFNKIEKEYLEAKKIAQNATDKPTIISGVQFNDVWNLPAGESFVAQFLKDANTNYLWADTKGKGSLSLSFESVFERAQNADLWISPGHYTSFSQLLEANQHYARFDAFSKKKVYSFSLKTGENNGVIYYELAPVQPHLVLKDLIKVVHPELLPEYQPNFLEKLRD